jgi:isocitrate dehydrogenase
MAELLKVGKNGKITPLDHPVVPFIRGEGIGLDIWPAVQRVLDQAATKYGRQVSWTEVPAGEEAYEQTGNWLPPETIEAFRTHLVGIKGPLSTPTGGGPRSMNVALRKALDLYVCVRPILWYQGVPTPVKHPEQVDMVVFRENVEDVYAGYELEPGSTQATDLAAYLHEQFGWDIPDQCGLGLKPISEENSKRLIRAAITYALENDRRSVTLVHKGNIQKFTEGAFCRWGYEILEDEFADTAVSWEACGGHGNGKLVIQDMIADNAFQQFLLAPTNLDVIATTNLNGDYISDAIAAQVGGIGISPGANINYVTGCAVFEATHGTAPAIAGQDKANPSAMILSGAMLFDHIGWPDAARAVRQALAAVIASGNVTSDFAALDPALKQVSCSHFSELIANQIHQLHLPKKDEA